MIIPTISTLLLVSRLVSALPFNQVVRNLPRDVTHIALDEENGRYIAYKRDGSLYGTYSAHVERDFDGQKRDGVGQCTPLSIDEAKTLPGFPLIDQYAAKNWGTGSHQTVTNPSDFLGSPATACVGGDVVQVQFTGNPDCITQTAHTAGQLVGTNGTVALSFQQGFSESATWTVTKSSTLGVAVQVSAKFGIPDVAEVTTQVTVSADFTNTVSSAFTTTSNNLETETLTLNSVAGKTCNAQFNSQSCNTQGKGQVRYLASGWVWYNYDVQTQGHYKWAANIEAIITNEDDRSSFLEFTGSMQSSASTNYTGVCA